MLFENDYTPFSSLISKREPTNAILFEYVAPQLNQRLVDATLILIHLCKTLQQYPASLPSQSWHCHSLVELYDLKLPDKTVWLCSTHLVWEMIKDYAKWMHGDKNKIEIGKL